LSGTRDMDGPKCLILHIGQDKICFPPTDDDDFDIISEDYICLVAKSNKHFVTIFTILSDLRGLMAPHEGMKVRVLIPPCRIQLMYEIDGIAAE